MTETRKRSLSPLAIVLSLSAVFFVIFLAVSGMFYLTKSPGGTAPAAKGPSLFGKGSVAVLEVTGPIMDSKKVLRKLERLEEDTEIRAVVVRLNSPGGAVAPSQEIYEAVKKFKKPVVASMGSVAASGAFYIAMGAKKVYANPGTLTGSIGVIMEMMNLEKLYEWAKIRRFSIKTGKFKDVGAEYREMTPEERQLLQTMVNDVLSQFKKAVAEGRKMTMAEVDAVADGRILSGNQAKDLKLVDTLGTLQEAIEEAAKMAGIKGKPNVVYPDRKRTRWIEFLLDDAGRDENSESARFGGDSVVLRAADALLRGIGGQTPAPNYGEGMTPGLYWIWNGYR